MAERSIASRSKAGRPMGMFHVYILKSIKNNRFYIGSTVNIEKILARHNRGGSVYTKNRGPFELAYSEDYATRAEAVRRERQIKDWKGSKKFQELLKLKMN